MRLLYPLLLITVLAIVGFTLYRSNAELDPLETASDFMAAVKRGDYVDTVKLFGGNACRCPKKGGWVSYLIYASAQEPNLAFLMGRSFRHDNEKVTPIEHTGKGNAGNILPWQMAEDVVADVDLLFPEKGYRPMFLPLKMAYGQEMTLKELEEFAANPDSEAWKGFTLRLRPSLAKGAVTRPEESKGIKYKPLDETPSEINKKESVTREDKAETDDDHTYVYEGLEDEIIEALGQEAAMYLHPKDAGPVKRSDGTVLALEEIAAYLPRMTSARLRLHIVRRGKLRKWTVYHLALIEPNLVLNSGREVELTTIKKPRFKKMKRDKKTTQ